MRQTFSISFYCRNSKVSKKNGLAPVELSICINGKRSYITLARRMKPADFEKAMNSKRGNDTKEFCGNFYTLANNATLQLLKNGDEITMDNVKNMMFKKDEKKVTLKDAWIAYLKTVKPKVENSITLTTFYKYTVAQKYSHCFFGGDKVIEDINTDDISRYYSYLVNENKLSINYANKQMFKLKAVLKHFNIDVFNMVSLKDTKVDVEYLTIDEVKKIESKDLHNERLGRIRDLFLFQCYTGLAFTDMQGITENDIYESEDGKYLKKERQKTGVTYTILLLPKAIEILQKYGWQLPKVTNQKMNAYLKEIAILCNIEKPLHSHIGRHTAGTLFLNAGLSIEEVAKILGHSNTKITTHYAKMMDNTVLKSMSKIKL